LCKAGKTRVEVDQVLRFNQGPVSGKLTRNARWRDYRFQQAHRSAQAHQQQTRHQLRKLTSQIRRAIAHQLRAIRGVDLSHEWIYQMI
jgi:hypothetical protein